MRASEAAEWIGDEISKGKDALCVVDTVEDLRYVRAKLALRGGVSINTPDALIRDAETGATGKVIVAGDTERLAGTVFDSVLVLETVPFSKAEKMLPHILPRRGMA